MSELGLLILVPILITDAVLAVALLWMWYSGWARDDQRYYRRMQRTYKEYSK